MERDRTRRDDLSKRKREAMGQDEQKQGEEPEEETRHDTKAQERIGSVPSGGDGRRGENKLIGL